MKQFVNEVSYVNLINLWTYTLGYYAIAQHRGSFSLLYYNIALEGVHLRHLTSQDTKTASSEPEKYKLLRHLTWEGAKITLGICIVLGHSLDISIRLSPGMFGSFSSRKSIHNRLRYLITLWSQTNKQLGVMHMRIDFLKSNSPIDWNLLTSFNV